MSDRAKQMASLFQVDNDFSEDVSSSDEFGQDDIASQSSFAERSKTVNDILEPAPLVDAIINDSSSKNEETVPQQLKLTAVPGLSFSANDTMNGDAGIQSVSYAEEKKATISVPSPPPPPPPSTAEHIEMDNPLGLNGHQLMIFNEMRKKYPDLQLSSELDSFKNFYIAKFIYLSKLLSRYALLDLREISQEIDEINKDYSLGEDDCIPRNLINNMNICSRAKFRLSTLYLQATEQLPVFERVVEILRGKLQKEHHSRGPSKDALAGDHMFDLEIYAAGLKGLVSKCKHADAVIENAQDTLSRQLSAITMEVNSGIGFIEDSDKYETGHNSPEVDELDTAILSANNSEKKFVDSLDIISKGTIIKRPESQVEAEMFDFGSVTNENDAITNILGQGKR